MGFDPSVLLQAQGVQLPNPMDLAGKAMTLGNLATSTQVNQMNLQGMQQYANAIPGLVSQNWSPEAIQQAAQQNPLGFAKAMQEYKAQQLVQAQMAEAQGKAAQAQAEAKKIAIKDLTTLAYQFGDKPDAGPKDFKQFKFMADSYGFPVSDPPSATASPTEWQGYFKGWGSAAVTPKEGVDINAIQSKLPGEVAKIHSETDKNYADIGKIFQETKAIPQDVQSRRMDANANVTRAETGRLEFQNPNPIPSNVGGGVVIPQRTVGPGGSVATTLNPGADAQGNPVQVNLTPGQADLTKGFSEQVAKQAPNVQRSVDLQQQITRIKALDAQGIYNGPLGASQFWKDITGVVAPFMSPEDRAKVENSQAFGAEAQSIVGSYMNNIMGGHMSRGALVFGKDTKPSDAMQPGARDLLYDSIYNSQQRYIDYWKQAADYASNPQSAVKGPGGFTPQFRPDVKAPTSENPRGGGKTFDSMPDPAKFPGQRMRDDQGNTFKSDGKQWVRM